MPYFSTYNFAKVLKQSQAQRLAAAIGIQPEYQEFCAIVDKRGTVLQPINHEAL
jgi:hypothetical protein